MRKFIVLSLIFYFFLSLINYSIYKSPIREVASNKSLSCIELIENFYPIQSQKFIKERFENAITDPHLFFRSFPPLYYQLMEKNSWEKAFKNISQINSVMAGDAHMENFGLKFFNKHLRFSVNDYDDLTKGPIFLDYIRLLTSAKLAGVKLDQDLIKEVTKFYKSGINKENIEPSSILFDLIKKSNKTTYLNSKSIDVKSQNFIKRKEPNFDIDPTILEEWESKLVSKGKIKDAYLYKKSDGGSAGLNRFQFLVENNGELNWIEAKEWSLPSYNISSKFPAQSDFERLKLIHVYDRPINSPEITTFQNKTYYLRYIDNRQIGVKLEDLKSPELEEILSDEFYALGDFHQTFLQDKKELLMEIEKLDFKEILDFVEIMEDEIKNLIKN